MVVNKICLVTLISITLAWLYFGMNEMAMYIWQALDLVAVV
jgi:hypothetical protein